MEPITRKRNLKTVKQRMRLLFYILAVMTVQLTLTSCPPDKEEESLEVKPADIRIEVGEEKTISVTSNTMWNVSCNASWLSLSSMSGAGNGNITVQATEYNPSEKERTATITVKSQEITRSVQVVQAGAPAIFLTATPTELSFMSESGQLSFQISSNTSWTVRSNAGWCTISKASGNSNGQIEVSVSQNTSTTSRNTTIDVNGEGGSTVVIHVAQAGQNEELSISKTTISDVPSPGGSYTVMVTSNMSWTASCNKSWCSVSPKSGDKSEMLNIRVDANKDKSTRNAEITVKGGSTTKTITVSQLAEADYLEVDKSEISFSQDGGNSAFSINTNVSWSISSGASWCSVSPSSGSGSKTVAVTANANEKTTKREATITVTGINSGFTKKVKVTQEPCHVGVAVDLGLPSGTKWANMNVGAAKPEDYGGYFAWGETKTKGVYDSSTYKYFVNYSYVNIGSDIAGTQYDAATANWGAPWKMPTVDQIQELLDNTTSTWTTLNGVYGEKFTSKINGNSIFLPAAGYREFFGLDCTGSSGYYWSSTLLESYPAGAYNLYFRTTVHVLSFYKDRYWGQSVRPVR